MEVKPNAFSSRALDLEKFSALLFDTFAIIGGWMGLRTGLGTVVTGSIHTPAGNLMQS
jgi:hypothetical protein